MKRTAVLLLSLVVVSFGSCGGGGGGGGTTPPPPVTISISPTTATVGAGDSVQFTATVRNSSNTAVTWQVEGNTGGSVDFGTISTAGQYTAPLAIPAGGTVTIQAVSQADTSKSASASVTIVFSSAMLSGPYAFSYIGWDPDFFTIAGSFLADGSGAITGGVADLNSYDGVFPAITLTGTYSTAADGRVEILLDDSLGNTYTLHAVLISPGHLRMIQFDSPATVPPMGANGQGVIDKQDPAAFNDASFAGGYAFRFDGYGFTACTVGIAGRMTADNAGNLTNGIMDINECGIDTNGDLFTGTYSPIDSNGRGEILLDTPEGLANFAFYVISADKANLVSIDSPDIGDDYFPWMLGVAEKQTSGAFSNVSVSGGFAYYVSGYSTTGIYYSAGRFSANGSGAVSDGVSDENNAGSLTENLAFTGNYLVAADGRGTAAFTSSRGTSNFSFYLVSASRALFVQQGDFAVATGEMDAQQGVPFSTASLTGNYGFSLDGYPDMLIGQFDATGAGTASGIVDGNNYDEINSEFVPVADQDFTVTYSVTANGRGNFTVTDPSGSFLLHIYMVSGSKAIVIGVDEMLLGIAEKQF
jgi:phage gp45-like